MGALAVRRVVEEDDDPVLIGCREVERVVDTRQQTGLDRSARSSNLRGAFAVDGPLKARHVAIVDDVITAGTAIRESREIICAADARIAGVLIALDRQRWITVSFALATTFNIAANLILLPAYSYRTDRASGRPSGCWVQISTKMAGIPLYMVVVS